MNRRPELVSLKAVAESVGLSPTTVSLVLNRSERAKSIPERTRQRVVRAAQKLNYRPNYFARYLSGKPSLSVGVIVPEIGDGYPAAILSAIERRLTAAGYFHIVASHAWSPKLIEKTPWWLVERGVEGIILVNMPLETTLPVPVVSIGERRHLPGVTNITIDNSFAVRTALHHLVKLGHSKIAFFKGHPGSADTEDRWRAILDGSKALGIEINPRLTVQLKRDRFPPSPPMPEEGVRFAQKLLARRVPFTALFAFNDISAIGAISALKAAGKLVPQEVSVVGVDDILASAFVSPPLTTMRQPLQKMGELAADILLERMQDPGRHYKNIRVRPQLIVRESTSVCRSFGACTHADSV